MQPDIELQSKLLSTYKIPDDFRLQGWVYVLSNPCMPGIYKIGMTTGTPEIRAKEISQGTGVPMPFEVVRAFYSHNPYEDEKEIHNYLAPVRVNESREFFKATLDEIDLAASECCLIDRDEPAEILADSYNVFSFNRKNHLNLDQLFEDIGIDIFGCKVAAAEAMIRMSAVFIAKKAKEGVSVIFHGNKARLIKSDLQKRYEEYNAREVNEQEVSGVCPPEIPGGF